MGSDKSIRANKVVVRCCYGVCLGFGFVVTTLSLAAMFWIFWCYFGLSIIHFTDTQRRAVVNYSFTTTKSTTVSPTPSPIRNTPSDIPETSLNQIPGFATASSGSHRIESPTSIDKRKESPRAFETSLPKGDFATRERVNKTTSRDYSLQGSSKDGTLSPVTLKENTNKEGNTNLNSEVTRLERVPLTHANREITKDHTRNPNRGESQPELKKVSDSDHIIDPYAPRKEDEKTDYEKEKTTISTLHSDNEKDFVSSAISNPRLAGEIVYPVPEFERSHTQRTSSDEIRRGYDDKDIPRRDTDQSSDRYSKGDGRVLPKDVLEPSVRTNPTSTERRFRDTYPEDDKYYDRYPSERRGDRYDEDRYRDRITDDRRFTDRYPSEERRRVDDRLVEDRHKYEATDDSDKRTSRVDDRKINREEPVRDDRRLDRLPDEDKYAGRYPESRRREGTGDRPYRDNYRDREPDSTRYSSEGRIREEKETYDVRPANRDRYLERRPDDYRYTDRYADEGRLRRNRNKNDDSLVREDRYRDRIPDEGRYADKYPDEERRRGDDDRFDDRMIRKDDDYNRRADERYLDEERRRNSEDRYRDRNYDERTRYRDDRIPYRDRRVDEISKSDRDRDNSEGSYRSRDRTDIRDSRMPTSSSYDDRNKDDRYRVDEDRFRDEAYKNGERSLMSSRRDERFQPERTRTSVQDYTSRDTFREPEYVPSKEYTTTYTGTDIPRPIRETTSEDRYRSVSRNDRPDIPHRYDDRDRILPTRVRDDTYVSRRDEAYTSRSRYDDRRNDDRYSIDRTDTLTTKTKYQDDRKIAPSAILGTRIESSRAYPDSREYRPTRIEETENFKREEVSLGRRSYSSEEEDEYRDVKTRPRYSTDSRNQDRTFYEDRKRDYEYANSRPKYDDEVDEYRQRRRSDYNSPSSRSTDTYTRDQVSRYDEKRESRYDGDRDRNPDLIDEDRDRHDRNRGDYDRHPTNKNHYGIVDNYGKDRDGYDSDIDSSRSYDRHSTNDGRIRSPNPDKSYHGEDTKRDLSGNQRTVHQMDERGKSLRPLVDTGLISKYNQRQPSDSSLPKTMSPSRTRDSIIRSSVSRIGDLLPLDVAVRDKKIQGIPPEQDEEQPLSAKDVIEAALRHSETHEQPDRKVFYPVFDPRISNLTSPDIIRPSERRGTTITAKKKR